MSKEYIERGALESKAVYMHGFGKNKYVPLKAIQQASAADVVEVVRCKDCTMWDRDHISCEGRARCLTGEGGIRYRGSNDFCSIGAKMDGGADNG